MTTPAEHYELALLNLDLARKASGFGAEPQYYVGMANAYATLALYRPPVTVVLDDFVPPARAVLPSQADVAEAALTPDTQTADDHCAPYLNTDDGTWTIGDRLCVVRSSGYHATPEAAIDDHNRILAGFSGRLTAALREAEIAELNGDLHPDDAEKLPPEAFTRPWRAQVHVLRVDCGQIVVRIPARDNDSEQIRIPASRVPAWVMELQVGSRVYAMVNVGAENPADLHFFEWEQPTPELDAHVAEMFSENHQVKPGVIVSAIPTTVTEYKHDGKDWQVTTSPAEPVQTTCYACFGEAHPDCDICLGRGTVAAIHPAHPDNHGDHSTCDPVLCLPAAERHVKRVTDEHAARDAAAPVRVSDERVAVILAALNTMRADGHNAYIEALPDLITFSTVRGFRSEVIQFQVNGWVQFGWNQDACAWEVTSR